MKKRIWIGVLCGSLLIGSFGVGGGMMKTASAKQTGAVVVQNPQQSIQRLAAVSKPAAKFVVTKKSKEYLKKGLLFGYGINFKMDKKQMIQKFGPITGSYEYEGNLYTFKKLGNISFSFNGLLEEGSIFSVLMGPDQYGKIDQSMVKKAWGKPDSEGPSDENINEYFMFYDFGNVEAYVSSTLHSNTVTSISIVVR